MKHYIFKNNLLISANYLTDKNFQNRNNLTENQIKVYAKILNKTELPK